MYPLSGTYVPVIGYTMFGRSGLRRDILRLFFTQPRYEGHVREIARQTGHAASATGRELDRLEREGVLRSTAVGRSRVYQLAADSALVRQLRPLVERSFGAEALLSDALASANGVEEAFIFGSYASPAETPRSDIDVLVIGRPDDALWRRVSEIEGKLGREVNLKHYTRSEIDRLRREGSEFIRSAFAGRRATLIDRRSDDGN